MQIPFFNTRVSRSSPFLGNVLSLLCIFTFLNALSLQICNAADPGICNAARYANGSQFESNLNTVLNNLVQHTSSSGGYNTTVFGQLPNKIYGLLQCRGDVSMEDCYNCSQEAKTSILQVCPNAAGGRVWRDKCYMRYENYSFIGQLDTNSAPIYYNVNNATNPESFSSSVRGLFQNLSDKAPLSEKRFATGSTRDLESFQKINGLVQCWRDISSTDCDSCLTRAISVLLGVTNGTKIGGVCYLGSCTARYEVDPFFTETPPSPPPSLPPPSVDPPTTSFPSTPAASTSKKSSNKKALVGGIVGGLLVMLLVGVAIFAKRRKFKAAVFGRPIRLEGRDMDEDSLISEDRPTIFNLETLKTATGNFHNDNKLGEGGFGPVYKGTLIDGKEIAVKKLSLKSFQGKQEFLNEFKLVAKLQHKNLVHIFGCCAEGSERLIVYEYLPNKSLDKLLFDPLPSKQLEWEMRFNIILGIARGLVYLHEDSRERIIHRDIKASNILLDQKMNPKIADFGLARLFVEDETHVSTRVAGTFGYMAPEYAMRGQLSVKADVYSFGVLLFEIVCGRKNTDFRLSEENQFLIEVVWRSFVGRHVVDVIDKKIVENCGEGEAVRCIHVGLLCTQEDASVRPNMSSVYSMLSNPSTTNLPHPNKPAFVNTTNKKMRHSVSSSATTSTSINDASVTDLGGR